MRPESNRLKAASLLPVPALQCPSLRCQAAGGKSAVELQIKAHAYVSARDAHKVNVVPVAVELVIRS